MLVVDEQIIRSAQRGDTEAFRQMVERCSNYVYAVVFSKVGEFLSAQDVAQEVFIKAFLHLPQLQDRPNSEDGCGR